MTRKITILNDNGTAAFVLADDSLGRTPSPNRPTRQLLSCEPGGDAVIQQYDPFRGEQRITKNHEWGVNQSCLWRPRVAYGFSTEDELFLFQTQLQELLPPVGTVKFESAGGIAYLENAKLRPFETVTEMAVLWVVQFAISGGITSKTRP